MISALLGTVLAAVGVLQAPQAASGGRALVAMARAGVNEVELTAAVSDHPDDARTAVARLLAMTAASPDSSAGDELDAAERLARAYAAAWRDSTPLGLVTRSRTQNPTERRAKAAIDSLRVAGVEVYARQGPAAANRIWRESLRRAEEAHDTLGRGGALGNIGAGLYREGALDSAAIYLERSWNVALGANDYRTAGNAIGTLASVRKDQGDLRRASELYTVAIGLRERVGDTRGLAADYNNLGLIAERGGDREEARRGYRDALALNRRYNRAGPAATNLVNLANIASLDGEHADAIRLYGEALRLSEEVGDRAGAAQALVNTGRLEVRRGDYPAAVLAFEQAITAYRQLGSAESELGVRLDLATARAAMGELQAALRELSRAERLATSRRLGWKTELAVALATADLALQFNQLPQADAQYRRAERLARQRGEGRALAEALRGRGLLALARDDARGAARLFRLARDGWERAGDSAAATGTALLLGHAQEGVGDTAGARTTWSAVQAISRRMDDVMGEVSALGSLAGLELRAGRPLGAESLYVLALTRVEGRVAPSVTAWLRGGYAAALESRGALADAAAQFRVAVTEVERMSGTLRVPGRRASFLSDKWDLYARLAGVERSRGQIDSAFLASERMRARQMLDLLARGRVDRRAADDSSPMEQDLRRRIVELTGRLEEPMTGASELRGDAPRAAVRAADREALGRAQEEYAELLMRLRESRPEYANVVTAEVAPWREVARRLAPDEILLEYLVSDSGSLVFAVTAETLEAVELSTGRQEFARLVDFARGMILLRDSIPGRRLWRGPLHRLHEALIGPVEQAGLLAGKRRLIIVPHAELSYLPFAALLEPGTTDRFLVERFEIGYAPSASVWLRLGERAAAPAPTILALAPEPAALPGTRAEVRAIGRIFGTRATVLEGRNASEERFRELAPQHDLVHLATSGVVNQGNPLFSRVSLSAGNGGDGRLEVHEVFGLHVQARLLVLSACQTGLASGPLADVPAGDDWVGLVQAFLEAGAWKVLATAWPVEDRRTAEFMERFYQHYGTGDTEAGALARTQRDLLLAPATRHPRYWAGFMLTGGH